MFALEALTCIPILVVTLTCKTCKLIGKSHILEISVQIAAG